jgi:hypothetical protein
MMGASVVMSTFRTPSVRWVLRVALTAAPLLAAACNGPAPAGDTPTLANEPVASVTSAITAVTCTSSHAPASGVVAGLTASGGNGNFTGGMSSCMVTTNTSGGGACTIGAGGVVTYTTGATAGYNIKTRTSGDYLLLSSTADGGAGSIVQTGGLLPAGTAELWNMAVVAGTGFTFQSAGHGSTAGTGMYMRNNAGTLVADQMAAGAATFTMTDCSGTLGSPGVYNRVGFLATSGVNPWWRTNAGTPYTPITFTGAYVCAPTNPGSNDAYFLSPGIDVLTVTDSAGDVGTCSVNVEEPVAVFPPVVGVLTAGTAVPAVQTWGGSTVYSSCAVTTNASMSVGGCQVAGPNYTTGCSDSDAGPGSWCGGEIVYTTGPTAGTDVLTITDSDGNTGTLTVVVGGTVVDVGFTTSTDGPLPPKTPVVLTTGTGGVTWTFVSNNSGATLNAATGSYTAGATGNVSDVVSVTDGTHTGTVIIEVGPPITVTPPQATVQPNGSVTFTATGGKGSGYTWSVTGDGTINAATGAYTAGATGGTAVVKVVDSLGNQATVTVTISCGADASLQILYPYNKTVFPLGMLPPLVQWKDNGTVTYAKVTLQYPTTGTPVFQWSEIVKENGPLSSPYNLLPTALPVTGGGRAQIPPLIWTTFQNAASGSDALISVQTLENNEGTIPVSITVHFANAQLKGTIYYQSYDTSLVRMAGDSSAVPQGAVLGIQIGSPTPFVADGSHGVCRDCHSLSASGTVMVVNDSGGATDNNLYGGSHLVSFPSAAETIIPPALGTAPNDGRFSWPAVSPDGTMMFTSEGSKPVHMSGQWGNATGGPTVDQLASGLYSISTGLALPTTGLIAGFQAKFPAWATDTSAIAFNYASGANGFSVGDDISLALMNVTQPTAGTWSFSTPQVLFTPTPVAGAPTNSGAAEWPSFMPAGQNGIVFQNRVGWGCTEPGSDDASTAPNTGNTTIEHDVGALGELWWVNTTGTPAPQRLSNANGAGYLPLGPNGHGAAGVSPGTLSTTAGATTPAALTAGAAGACPQALGNIFGNGNDTWENFKPTVNPQLTGGYQWVVFTSRRMYGNVATINPYASDPSSTPEIRYDSNPVYPESKKLWVAAMNTNPAAGSDPSYPAFYLDGQELYAGNSRSYWVLPQCVVPSATRSAATVCTSNQDCCATGPGTPASCTLDVPIAANPPTRHCVPTSAITCSANGAACNVDTDCCNFSSEGARCASGTCQVPAQPGYPASESVTYDFQSNCVTAAQAEAGANPSGNATVWEFLQTDQVIPAGTNITVSFQTAATEAGLSTAQAPTAPYSLSATIAPPSYYSGPPNTADGGAWTVDYDLRNPTAAGVKAQASLPWLRVTVTLVASSNGQSAPTLTSLVPTFDCAPSE